MSGSPSASLPEDLLSFVCDHYTSQRQLGSLARLMTLNQRTSQYVRKCLYRQFDFVDDRSSRYLKVANEIHEKYEGGDELDEDILSAIDCKEVDPLDLEPELRWLRNFRMVEKVEVKDMLYGRDIGSLYGLAESLGKRGLLLFPNLKELMVSPQVTRRIHAAEAKYPKRTPMDLLVILFLGSNVKCMTIGDSTLFTPPPPGPWTMQQALGAVNGRYPPGKSAHISHAIIQFIQGMHTLNTVIYLKVDPFVPIRPKRGIRHIVSFRPIPPPPLYTPAGPSTIISRNPSPYSAHARQALETGVDERSYIWEIRQAMIDIIHRSVIPLAPDAPPEAEEDEDSDSDEPDTDTDPDSESEQANPEANQQVPTRRARTENVETRRRQEERRTRNAERRAERELIRTRAGLGGARRRQSSWVFILPFGSEANEWTGTLKMQVRDMVRRKYDQEELVDEILENLEIQFNET